jgi:hypothetical protein
MNYFIEQMTQVSPDQKENLKNKVQNASSSDQVNLFELFALLRLIEYYSICQTIIIPKTDIKPQNIPLPDYKAQGFFVVVNNRIIETLVCVMDKELTNTNPNDDILSAISILAIAFGKIIEQQPLSNSLEKNNGKYIIKNNLKRAIQNENDMKDLNIDQPLDDKNFAQIGRRMARKFSKEPNKMCNTYVINIADVITEIIRRPLDELTK